MIRFQLPTEDNGYLDLALPTSGSGLVSRWGTQSTPFTVATWEKTDTPPVWQLKGRFDLSPDGEWLSTYDPGAGKVSITGVGASAPAFVVARDKKAENIWTAVAPGGGRWPGRTTREQPCQAAKSWPR